MVPFIPWHESWLVSCGQNMMHVEFVVGHAVRKGQEDSVGLPLGTHGGHQVPQQVIKWLEWLSFTQGPLINLDTTIQRTLLF